MPDVRHHSAGLRLLAGYGAILCAIPYLVLKIVWLSGGELGVANPRLMHDASMVTLNAITAGMDVVGIAIALTFTHRFGLRIPAWLVLPPMWVATGLLARFVVAVPIAAIAALLASHPPLSDPSGPVQAWVYIVVYTGFAGLGIGLMLAFFLYARRRWDFIVEPMTSSLAPSDSSRRAQSVTRSVQIPLASTAALIAAGIASLHIAWAAGATVGLPADLPTQRTIVSHVINVIDAVPALAAAVGVLAIVFGPWRHVSFRLAVVLAWVGGGSLFSWGTWHLINVLGDTALIRGRAGAMVLLNFAALLQLIAGLVIGVVMLVALAERDASVGSAPSGV
jgi:hypothetical protein